MMLKKIYYFILDNKFKFKSLLFYIFYLLFLLILVIILSEVFLRLLLPDNFRLDSKYGWDNSELINNTRFSKYLNGSFYENSYVTFKHGFKKYSEPNINKTRILFIGDSFTHATEVNVGDEYFNYLESETVQIFAKGVSGWGTLQEFLFLEDFYDFINPDIIVIQFYENDFFNNHYILEKLFFLNNDQNFRPYLENNKIVYRNPSYLNLPSFFMNSRILQIINSCIKLIRGYEFNKNLRNDLSIESFSKNNDLNNIENIVFSNKDMLNNSIKITNKILKKFNIFDSDIYIFYIDDVFLNFNFKDYFLQSLNKTNLTYIEIDPIFINYTYYDIYTSTYHLNAYGHKLLGNLLKEKIFIKN